VSALKGKDDLVRQIKGEAALKWPRFIVGLGHGSA
jgi:hypothetical protein